MRTGYIVGIISLILVGVYYMYKAKKNVTQIKMANIKYRIPEDLLYQFNKNKLFSVHYSYGIWLNITDFNYKFGQKKNIFIVKADADKLIEVSLASSVNDLVVSVLVGSGSTKVTYNCTVQNIPLQKWMYVFISVTNKVLDIYLDGKMVKTCIMNSSSYLPETSTALAVATLHDGPDTGHGFSGFTSRFLYWPVAANPKFVWDHYAKGYGSNSQITDYSLELTLKKGGEIKEHISM